MHLEADGKQLRLYNPATGKRLPTLVEEVNERDQELEYSKEIAKNAKAEIEQLQKELEALQRRGT